MTAHHSDIWNAEQFLSRHGTDLRHVVTWGKGLVWDGARWKLDETNRWAVRAQATARSLFKEALDDLQRAQRLSDTKLEAAAKKEIGHAIKLQDARMLAAMQLLARPHVSISHEALDADPWLLNVQNGTIDLRTGGIRPHRRADLMTKLSPVRYDPLAKCPTWDAFLLEAMKGDVSLVEYLQRLTGYALTGSVVEHVLVFFHGGGANGKSTFLGVVHEMLGDYAAPAPQNFLFRKGSDNHPTELTILHGRRFILCPEIEEGKVFDEALVKDLTGGDKLTARRMREDFWSFWPTHKLFIAGQHKPVVRGDDEGIWRRMRLVPWLHKVPEAERDTQLKEKLLAELPGILAWAVRGCLAWQRGGLQTPAVVEAATKRYRAENDTLGAWITAHTVESPDAVVARRTLRAAYETYVRDHGGTPFGAQKFTSRLRDRGIVETKVRMATATKKDIPVDAWRGIRLKTEAEMLVEITNNVTQIRMTNGALADGGSVPGSHYNETDLTTKKTK